MRPQEQHHKDENNKNMQHQKRNYNWGGARRHMLATDDAKLQPQRRMTRNQSDNFVEDNKLVTQNAHNKNNAPVISGKSQPCHTWAWAVKQEPVSMNIHADVESNLIPDGANHNRNASKAKSHIPQPTERTTNECNINCHKTRLTLQHSTNVK